MSGSDDTMKELSRALLEDLVLISRVLLKGRIVFSRRFNLEDDILGEIARACTNATCYLSARLEGRGGGTLRAFIINGEIIACSFEGGGKRVFGTEAIDVLRNFKESGYTGAHVTLYTFDPSFIERTIESLSVKVTTKKREVPSILLNPRERISKELKSLGAPVVNVGIIESRDYIVIDVVCDDSKPLPSPKDLILATLGAYVDAVGKVGKKIKVTIHHRRTYSDSFDVSGNEVLWRSLGAIPSVLWKHGLFIDRVKYRVRGGVLEVSLTLKRYDIYSTVSIDVVAREIYEQLRKVWGGAVIVRTKIGALGLEAKMPP